MPEQVKRPYPWRKMMIINVMTVILAKASANGLLESLTKREAGVILNIL
jgi:hypothetical protein